MKTIHDTQGGQSGNLTEKLYWKTGLLGHEDLPYGPFGVNPFV